MGLFDKLFRRNKNLNMDNNTLSKNNNLILKYKSGTKCEVEFSNLSEIILANGNNKMVQEVLVTYTEPDGSFLRKSVMLDPQIVEDKDGNKFYATKEFYENLAKDNKGLVKGFFQKDQLNAIENNYIGHIGVDAKTGAYNRSYDRDLKVYYDDILKNKKEMQQANREQTMQQQLIEQTRRREDIEINYKDSHAEKLDPSMMPEWMKSEDELSI